MHRGVSLIPPAQVMVDVGGDPLDRVRVENLVGGEQVAHAGGVDAESSESTLEVRARLVAEIADMLALATVEVTDRHALVAGKLGRYSVYLGSAQVHRLPGNAVCIIPISSQHRGRVFLPFADDDPRTAEVMSKVLLLARDDKISDPTILEQLT